MARRILIVEDVALVAMDLELQARDAGWDVAGPASSVAEALALALALEGDIDAAVLDVEVGAKLVTPVALLLRARGVPFVFGSGHKLCAVLPADLHDATRIDKPFCFADVERALAGAPHAARAA